MKKVIKTVAALSMAVAMLGGQMILPQANSEIIMQASAVSRDDCDCRVYKYTYPNSKSCYGYGSTGDCVRWIQAALNYITCYNYNIGEPLVVDGIYGSKTKEMVKSLQRYVNSALGYHKLDVDGIFGPKTYEGCSMCLDCCGCC